MESTSVTTFVASFALQEIDYFVMLVVTAFVGWRIAEMVRLRFKKPSKTKGGKLSGKCEMHSKQMSPKTSWNIPPTQTPAARAVGCKPESHVQLTPQHIVMDNAGLQSPPGLDHLSQAPWRRQRAQTADTPTLTKIQQEDRVMAPIGSSSPAYGSAAVDEDNAERLLGRVVCFKETGYGFVVDEAGERLFVRQAEVEGGEQLKAGQLVWFRRGRRQGNQAVKALNVTIVSREAAKVMRQTAMTPADMVINAKNKALAPAPPKRDGDPPAAVELCMVPAEKKDRKSVDDDLCAFLGSGSKEEQIKNLKYAPQWVVEKFWSQQKQQPA